MGHHLGGVIGCLRGAAATQALGRLPDRELLARFVASNDDAAFAALVGRHGPTVFGVCRRALPCRPDAEDACQAVFLVLARKAASLSHAESLGGWLHGVASRVAAQARRAAARRRSHEAGAVRRPPPDPAAEASWREVQAALDEELACLPERYRGPLILCYLECLTRDEAAARLGLSPGALHGLLERGRGMLRGRLEARGLSLSAALAAAALGSGVAQAMPPALAVASAKAAVMFAAGQPLSGVVGSNVVALTREVLMGMFMAKLKTGAAALLCTALLALAGGSLAPQARAQGEAPRAGGLAPAAKTEGDEEFIRRVSVDLRGAEPTPAEVHFFVSSKEASKRQRLIDLFIQERQARKEVEEAAAKIERLTVAVRLAEVIDREVIRTRVVLDRIVESEGPEALQKAFLKDLRAATTRAEVAAVTQAYLDRLSAFVKSHPAHKDSPEAIRQIVLLYESLGKDVEAAAWKSKLPPGAGPDRPGKGPVRH